MKRIVLPLRLAVAAVAYAEAADEQSHYSAGSAECVANAEADLFTSMQSDGSRS